LALSRRQPEAEARFVTCIHGTSPSGEIEAVAKFFCRSRIRPDPRTGERRSRREGLPEDGDYLLGRPRSFLL